jgi:nucleoside-diphosphate-sugar epimerase
MSQYLIVGAGPIGTAVAEQLVEQGHQVRIVTRSGSGPTHPLVERVKADATNEALLGELCEGRDAIFNCANPPYHRWMNDWPPIANSVLAAAKSSGAVLVTLSNLYAYGRPTGAMSVDSPFLADYEKAQVRATMWLDALAAHNNGEIRATEVRASDFLGPNAEGALGKKAVARVVRGKSVMVLGDSNQLHSWSYTKDVARTLIVCAQREEAWGHAWHAPTNLARTQREVVNELADLARVKHVRISVIPPFVLRVVGLFNPIVRELPKTLYQFTSTFIIDDSATRQTLGIEPTPWIDVLRDTVASARSAQIHHGAKANNREPFMSSTMNAAVCSTPRSELSKTFCS